jgi:hypothetical protein
MDTHKDHHQVGARTTEEWKPRGPVTLIPIVTEGGDHWLEWTALEHIGMLLFFPMKDQINWVLIHQFSLVDLFSDCEIADPPPPLHVESHRVPYFRYFGPTAIVPGFKQMVVSVREHRRSTGAASSLSSMGPLHTIFIIANRLQCLLDLEAMEGEVALHMREHLHRESLTQGRTLICPYTIKTILRL